MFLQLRVKLTALYILIAVIFVTTIGGATYGLLAYYFHSITDLALRHRMAHEFELLGLSLPPDLAHADAEWNRIRMQVWPQIRPTFDSASLGRAQQEWQAHVTHFHSHEEDHVLEETYDGELTSVFLIPLNRFGQVVSSVPLPVLLAYKELPDQRAVQFALQEGVDLRTIALPDGQRARLLTYLVPLAETKIVLQLGRVLADQDYILRRFLSGILVSGAVVLLISAGGSWWLAGRALQPVQASIERQRTFVANASHELRTPLTLIRASAEVVHNNLASQSEDRRLLADVIDEVDYLTRLVDDLLLLSRLDVGRLVLKRRRVDLDEFLCEAERTFAILTEGRNLILERKPANGAVIADPIYLRQALLAILDNAIRHTPDGGVITLEAPDNDLLSFDDKESHTGWWRHNP